MADRCHDIDSYRSQLVYVSLMYIIYVLISTIDIIKLSSRIEKPVPSSDNSN